MDKPLSSKANFQPTLDSTRKDYYGYFKAVANPSTADRKLKKYRPRLTYTQRPRGSYRAAYELAIELSLPKIVYGNNFDELKNSDFDLTVKRLQEGMREMGVYLFTKQIEEADVRSLHYSKNIVFTDYTSSSSVLKMLSTADVSGRYGTAEQKFRNGGNVFHVRTNSLDIAVYDKLADLRQAKTSEKRSDENDNYIQLSLLDQWKRQEPLAIVRFEVRMNGKKKLRSSLEDIGFTDVLTFKSLFSQELSQRLLLSHWETFFGGIKKIEADHSGPEALLANVLQMSDVKGPKDAIARWAFALANDEADLRQVRNMLEDRYGKHVWARVKPMRRQPNKVQYKALLQVDQQIRTFKPTKLEDISKHL